MTHAGSRLPEGRASARLSAFLERRGAALALAGAVLFAAAASPAAAATGQINKLADVTFTSLNPLVAASMAQSVCAYSSGAAKAYSIKATGSGAGGAFTLSGGGGLTLTYGVEWSATAGATSGTALTPGTPLSGQTSTAFAAGCTLGPSTTASLIVSIGTSDLQSALAGVAYTGSLTLLLTPQ